MCASRKKDCLFIDVFDALEQISKLYYKNTFYTSEINKHNRIKHNTKNVKKWLAENLYKDDIDLPYSSSSGIYYDKIVSLCNGKTIDEYDKYSLKFKGEDFKSSYDFLNIYNELFFTRKILPHEYNSWKIAIGYNEPQE